MGVTSVTLERDAYSVLFMHACKHASKSVNGVLLGSIADGGVITVQKALPFFHSSLALAPMLEVGLMLADEYCSLHPHLSIVGYYQANEMVNDLELGVFGRKIAEKISSHSTEAVALLIDGSHMQPSPTDLRLLVLTPGGRKMSVEPTLQDAESSIATLEGCLAAGKQQQLVDLDAHLDDATLDWLNTALLH